jgi:valine--pyruvate aminotransferase
MQFSNFAKRFSEDSGIVRLMEDLGEAMSGQTGMLVLGGGNPAHIPEVEAVFQERMRWLSDHPQVLSRIIGNYDSPRGNSRFINMLAGFFKKTYGWDIGPENIVLTAGSQNGFFLLFNTLAGTFPDGSHRHILLPLVPEYIGYSDVGLSDDLFIANRPLLTIIDDHSFKYHIDFDTLHIGEHTGALCVSRPTNPTGNVLSDGEMHRLHELAISHHVPLIIDNAYGMPFPNIIFTEASLEWSEQIILCMSLSKIGLPAVRTGVILASEELTATIARLNGIISLALGSIGPALALDLINSGKMSELSNRAIKPYYQAKAQRAQELFHKELQGVDYYIHKPEGAIFLWIWFPELPVTSAELYRRLKDRGVLVLSGHYFFPGLREDWRHKHECIRVSYAMDDTIVDEGIRIIADEVKQLLKNQTA